MTTVIAQVAAAIVASLQSGTPVSGNVKRARTRPGAAEWTDMVVVRPHRVRFERFAIKGGPYNLDTAFTVECYARAAPGTSPDVAIDSLVAAVYARLATDSTLGGLVSDLLPTDLDFDFDTDVDASACAAFHYTAIHRAQNQTLE